LAFGLLTYLLIPAVAVVRLTFLQSRIIAGIAIQTKRMASVVPEIIPTGVQKVPSQLGKAGPTGMKGSVFGVAVVVVVVVVVFKASQW